MKDRICKAKIGGTANLLGARFHTTGEMSGKYKAVGTGGISEIHRHQYRWFFK